MAPSAFADNGQHALPGAKNNAFVLKQAITPIIVAIVIALLPAPTGLAPHVWYFFAIFTGAVAAPMSGFSPFTAMIVLVND